MTIWGLPTTLAQEEHTTETADDRSGLDLVLPDPAELLWGFIAFVVLFVVMAKFALPALGKAMAGRTEKIQGDLDKAEQAREDAQAVLARYEAQLQDARTEAGRIIDEARRTADSLRADMMARAEEEARQVVARAQDEIRAERARAVDELRRSVGTISVDLASRVIGESLNAKRHGRLVDEFIDQLAAMGEGRGNGARGGG
ncbi:MAG: F0F1 ATP synthase subunit B [Actinomycetota bacterium]|nr:F0F1 ATP synthase subunit B [Actinomycetota bacterium]